MSSYFDDMDGVEEDDKIIQKGGDSDDDNSSQGSDKNEEEEEEKEEPDEDEIPEDDEDEEEEPEEEEPEQDDDEPEEQDGGGDGDEDGDDENEPKIKTKKIKIPAKTIYKKSSEIMDSYEDEDDEDEDDDGEQYLQKFDKSVNDNYVLNFHPESVLQNYQEILIMTNVVRNKDDIIVDKLHRTIPYLTKYERSRILGQRAKQINSGANPFVKVPEKVIDGYVIAEMELKEKKIPFIIRRPLPNGGSEYWKLQDLEDIAF